MVAQLIQSVPTAAFTMVEHVNRDIHQHNASRTSAHTPVTDIVTSTGLTASSPHCSWNSVCTWDAATQESCAVALCQAQGYTTGAFVEASNDMCATSFTSDQVWMYVHDTSAITFGNYQKEAQITASCETYPTPAPVPTPAGAGGGAAAVGDPHLQNVHGERFDLMKEGKHVLMTIPRGKDAEHALLRVQADARRMGNKCADMYFQEVNVTGVWAEAKNAGGYRYSVSQHDREAPEWVAFGKVELKVVHGRTDGGLPYLNVYMKHLRSAGVAIGGLLGEDDHEDVSTPPEACTRKVALAKRQTSGQALSSASSVTMATYEE